MVKVAIEVQNITPASDQNTGVRNARAIVQAALASARVAVAATTSGDPAAIRFHGNSTTSGNAMINNPAPIVRYAPRQPSDSTNDCTSGAKINMPTPSAAESTPIALGSRARNQRLARLDAGTAPIMVEPMALNTPISRYICHSALIQPTRPYAVAKRSMPTE